MTVFLNGRFVDEEHAVVSVFDRAFRYGDALFEAMLAVNGKIFRAPQHLARLQHSAEFLKIPLPYSADELLVFARELLQRNELRDAVLRVQLSRGMGPRGYAPSGQESPLVVMSSHATPPRAAAPWKLTLCSSRVATGDPLAGHKTCSRLLQVMAAAEARERGADESLLVNTDGFVNEGSSSNVFWIHRGVVCTPPLRFGILPGVTRAAILELCEALKIPYRDDAIQPADLPACDGVFLSLTSQGIVEAAVLDGTPLRRSPLTGQLRDAFDSLLARECNRTA